LRSSSGSLAMLTAMRRAFLAALARSIVRHQFDASRQTSMDLHRIGCRFQEFGHKLTRVSPFADRLRLPSSVSLRVYLSDVAGHFQTGEQLGVARFPSHRRFGHAMSPVSDVKVSPYFHQLIENLLLSIEAIFFRPCYSVVVKSDFA
jgi:hypothetical protein